MSAFYVSIRQTERAEHQRGGARASALHLSAKCASRFYGDAGEASAGFDEPEHHYCQRCARGPQREAAQIVSKET